MIRRRRGLWRPPLAVAAIVVAAVVPACGGKAAQSSHPAATSASPTSMPLEALAAFDRAFYRGTPQSGTYAKTTIGDHPADFWTTAEMIETAEDYYDYTGDPATARLVTALLRGFLARYGADWTSKYKNGDTGAYLGPRANDDIMWMVIATARAYRMTGDPAYGRMAASNFAAVYKRSWSSEMGGGIWWRVPTRGPFAPQKNTTTNAPAVIAACELYRDFHTPAYLAMAKGIYAWLRGHLYDPATGRVYDNLNITAGGTQGLDKTQYSYNQGTFTGAAGQLYAITHTAAYARDAAGAIDYTRAHLTRGGILVPSTTAVTGGQAGFSGIFARWAVRYARENGIKRWDGWFDQNARTAWAHRNAAGLMGHDWTVPPHGAVLSAWDCSSAVAMLEALFTGGVR